MWFYPNVKYTDSSRFQNKDFCIVHNDDGSIDGVIDLKSGEFIGFYASSSNTIYFYDSDRKLDLNERCLKIKSLDEDIYYDSYGNIIHIRDGNVHEYVQSRSQRIRYIYDSNGNLKETRQISKDIGSIEYDGRKYDEVSLVVKKDGKGNLISKTYYITVPTDHRTEGLLKRIVTFDNKGNVISDEHIDGPETNDYPFVYIDWFCLAL